MSRGAAFSRAERLREPSQFKKAFREGRLIKGGIFDFYILRNGLKIRRLGISIPKSREKLATKRNRFRRLLKESFRRSKLELPEGIDVVAVLKRGKVARNPAFDDVLKDLKGAAGEFEI